MIFTWFTHGPLHCFLKDHSGLLTTTSLFSDELTWCDKLNVYKISRVMMLLEHHFWVAVCLILGRILFLFFRRTELLYVQNSSLLLSVLSYKHNSYLITACGTYLLLPFDWDCTFVGWCSTDFAGWNDCEGWFLILSYQFTIQQKL